MRPTRPWTTLPLASVVLAFLLLLTSCSTAPPANELGRLQSLATACPDAPTVLVEDIEIDATGSSSGDAIVADRFAVIRDRATSIAVCGGRLRVAAFTSSVTASTVLYDDTLFPSGATQIARLRKVPALVEEVMTEVQAGYPDAVAVLQQSGTDVTAVLSQAAEYRSQLSALSDIVFSVLVLTDGVQNVGASVADPGLTPDRAADIASSVAVPDLTGASVSFVGVGRLAESQPATSYVDALKFFYDAVCRRSGADACIVVTDYAGGRA